MLRSRRIGAVKFAPAKFSYLLNYRPSFNLYKVAGLSLFCAVQRTACFYLEWLQLVSCCANILSRSLAAAVIVRSTIGDRTFPATAASVWNSLPVSVRSSPSLHVFRSRLFPGLTAMTKNVSLHWLLLAAYTWLHCLGLLLRVLVVLGLNATLKLIHPSSSSSS